MESGGKLEVNLERRRKNVKNSFAPTQHSFDNQFFNSNFTNSNHQKSQIELQNSRIEHTKKEKEKSERHESIYQKGRDKQIDGGGGKEKRMDEIRQEYVDLRGKEGMNGKDYSAQKQQKVHEGEKIKDLNKNFQQLTENLSDLKQNYKALQKQQEVIRKSKDISDFKIHEISKKKERQIKQFLRKKQQEKEERQQMKERLLQISELKIKQSIAQEQMLKQKERRRKLKELKKYNQFSAKHEAEKADFEQKGQIVKEYYKKYANYERFHERKARQEQQKALKEQQEVAKILEQRKQIVKPMTEEEIQQHQRWHDDKIVELYEAKQRAKEDKLKKIAEQNNRFQGLWKGNVHGIVQEERWDLKRKKQEPHEKNKKMKEYKQYVRENFIPKTYQSKSYDSSRIKNDSSLSHRQIKRYRYYKGIAYGQVAQVKPQAKSQQEVRKIGDEYLAYMRSLPKKKKDERDEVEELSPEDLRILDKKFNSIVKVKKQFHPLYDETRKNKITIDVPENPNRQELKAIMQQLKHHDQKLKLKQKLLKHQGVRPQGQIDQKQINQGLVDNIERKLSLLAQL